MVSGLTEVQGNSSGGRRPAATSRRVGWRRRTLAPTTLLVLALAVVALVLRLWPLGGYATDYQDEGAYWQSLRSMAAGHHLFREVFSSQPPFFLLGLFPFYALFGQTLVAARLGVVLYSLLGLAGLYYIARATGGRAAALLALALLIVDPLYLNASYSLQAEGPAVGLGAAGVALAAVASRVIGPPRRLLALAGGIVIGLGIMAKLFDVVAAVPAALYLLLPADHSWLGRADANTPAPVRSRLETRRARLRRYVRRALPDLILLALGAVVSVAALFLPYKLAGAPMYDQAIRFHLVVEQTHLNFGLQHNLQLIQTTLRDAYSWPYALLALVACLLAIWRRAWIVVPPLAWLLASLIVLARQQPLLGHQLVLIAPPLAVLASLVLPLISGPRLGQPLRDRASPIKPLAAALPVAAVLVVAAAALGIGTVRSLNADDARAQPIPAIDTAMARALDATTGPNEVIVTDLQYVAGLADRSVPPWLVDTSQVRITVGYKDGHFLSTGQVLDAIAHDHVRVILYGGLSSSHRLKALPGFLPWVRQHYRPAVRFGPDQVLYIKNGE